MDAFTSEQIKALSSLVDADRFSTGQSARELHVHDISPFYGTLPAGVIWPLTTKEVAAILTWTYANNVPVTPWGAGTSTEGNPLTTCGGLVMDFTRMDQILDVRPQDLQADVQPGVLRKTLNRHTGRHGLFFPPDPGADLGRLWAKDSRNSAGFGSNRTNAPARRLPETDGERYEGSSVGRQRSPIRAIC